MVCLCQYCRKPLRGISPCGCGGKDKDTNIWDKTKRKNLRRRKKFYDK
jgi:hypothetical protein